MEIQDISVSISENQAVSVDLGVKVLATLPNKTGIIGAKASRQHEKKLRRLNQV